MDAIIRYIVQRLVDEGVVEQDNVEQEISEWLGRVEHNETEGDHSMVAYETQNL